MKTCEAFAALLDPFVDGELSAEELILVQTHLDECPDCRAYVDDALAIRAAFPDVEETFVPADFADGVMAVIRTESIPRKKRPTPWVKVLAPLAACLAVVVLLQGGPLSPKLESAAPSACDTAAPAGGDVAVMESAAAETPAEAAPEAIPIADEAAAKNARDIPEAPAASAPQQYTAVPDSAPAEPEAAGAGAEDAWVENENVVFSAVVFLTPDYAGSALDAYAGKPYSNAEFSNDGVLGIGYALDQATFERILFEELDYPMTPVLNADRTTELCCIVVTDAPYAVG